ncbi:hypothetical protein MHYP_G00268400 [Metynnis hypsauchen]
MAAYLILLWHKRALLGAKSVTFCCPTDQCLNFPLTTDKAGCPASGFYKEMAGLGSSGRMSALRKLVLLGFDLTCKSQEAVHE